jgi:hypothetical protein
LFELGDAVGVIGVKDAIKHCFSSVFSEINESSEAWFQSTKLDTVSRDRYADFLARRVGQFPLFGTSRYVLVTESYVSVAVSSELEREKYKPASHIEALLRKERRGFARLASDSSDAMLPIDALEASPDGFALLGTAGSGKTTAFRYLAMEAAKGRIVKGRRRIPIYLAVRDLVQDCSLLETCAALLKDLGFDPAERIVETLGRSGRMMLLVDGLDETSEVHQKRLVREIKDAQSRFPLAQICVSGRHHALSLGLEGFSKWETLPLPFPARLQFIEKWFSAVDPAKGKQLITQSSARHELLDLGSSPLMLSIVCALFSNDLDIPADTNELFERSVHGMLGGWDAFRAIARTSPLRDLSVKRRTQLVAGIAHGLFLRGKIVFDADDINSVRQELADTFSVSDFACEASELLECLFSVFGIILERAPGLYSFCHLSLHEYLVAYFIVSNRQEINVAAFFRDDDRWIEVTKLIAQMLPQCDAFLSAVHLAVTFDSVWHVPMLCDIWRSRPSCTSTCRKKLFSGLFHKIASGLKGVCENLTKDNRELIVWVDERRIGSWRDLQKRLDQQEAHAMDFNSSEQDEAGCTAKRVRPLRNFDKKTLLVLALPRFLELLRDSNMTFDDVGLGNNPHFRLLSDYGWHDVQSVTFKNIRSR